MRGLPPVPAEVAELRLGWLVGNVPVQTQQWVFVPGLQELDYAGLRAVWSDVVTAVVGPYNELTATAASISTCRLRRWGSAGLSVYDELGPNAGLAGACQVLAAALGLCWHNAGSGRSSFSLTRLPGFPDAFTDDHLTLNTIGWTQAAAWGTSVLEAVSAIVSPAGGTCGLVSLERVRAGAPLPVSQTNVITHVTPVPTVATLVERGRSR